MKLTEELIKCQTREAQRVCDKNDVYMDADSYESGVLWAFYRMKEDLRDYKIDYFCLGFLVGGMFVFRLMVFVL